MASLLSKVIGFARSPQGRKLLKEAEKAAENPKTQREVEGLAQRVIKK
jgi:hypothetical protein